MTHDGDTSVDANATAASRAAWSVSESARLTAFARGSRHSDGFGYLSEDGRIDPERPVETWITGRMTYVFALASLLGEARAGELVDHGLAALSYALRDDECGGWFHSTRREDRKEAYDHAFVVLAAATAMAAGRPGAEHLLGEALACIDAHFWDAGSGLSVDVWDRRWTTLEDYRGANANMHLVEAFLAASDATGDDRWRLRALGIAERLIHGAARANHWRLPEHYDPDWRMLPNYNVDIPDHPFRPYGATVGHWLEWSRLLIHLHVGLPDPPTWLLDDAEMLFRQSVAEGWAVDGEDGFVYTVNWDGRPVVRQRMHWVVAEAIGSAAVLSRCAGGTVYAEWSERWWAYAEAFMLDSVRGSWHHQLDESNRPTSTVWSGKPDVYHAYQACILTRAPLAASVASAALALRADVEGA